MRASEDWRSPAASAALSRRRERDPAMRRDSRSLHLLALGRPTLVERLLGVCGNLQIGAVMIRIAARIVKTVIGHKLHDLQRAILAVDIRQLYVRLERLH